MSDEKRETDEIVDPFASSEPMMIVKNVTSDTLRFVLLDDGHCNARNVPEVERDHTKPPVVDERTGEKRFLPKLYPNAVGKPTQRQLRERPVEIPPKKSVRLPLRFLPALLTIQCGTCHDPIAHPRGCDHMADPEHRKTWSIIGGGRVSPTQVQIDALAGVPVDGMLREALESDAKAAKHNRWGRDLHEGAPK